MKILIATVLIAATLFGMLILGGIALIKASNYIDEVMKR